MKLYLSGRISDPDPVRQAQNLAVLDYCASEIRHRRPDIDVVNPAETAREHPGLEWREYMRLGIADLLTCDVHALMPSWSHSGGSIIEAFVSTIANIRQVRAPNCSSLSIPLPFIEGRLGAVVPGCFDLVVDICREHGLRLGRGGMQRKAK